MIAMLEARFMAKVDRNGPGGCWIWMGSRRQGPHDYGIFRVNGQRQYAHRVSYQLAHGEIPPFDPSEAEIDHLCRRPSCVNPQHLEVVPHRVNMLRGHTVIAKSAEAVFCRKGHRYDGELGFLDTRGHRQCRACHREAHRRHWAKNKERLNAQQRARYAKYGRPGSSKKGLANGD